MGDGLKKIEQEQGSRKDTFSAYLSLCSPGLLGGKKLEGRHVRRELESFQRTPHLFSRMEKGVEET